MEDIEYLEEYEDLILPKTLNYSEEFPVNEIEGDLLAETCDNLNPELASDEPECEDNNSRCSPIRNSGTNKSNLIKIINTEVLRIPAQVQNFNKEGFPTTSIPQETQQLQFRYDRQNATFLDRISQNPVLQRLDKYKSVATVKPTLQRAKTFRLSAISPPFASTDTKIQIISNSECVPKLNVNVSNKGIEDDSFLDYAVEKHGPDDFNLEFNLDTAEISDICSDSLNFSDDYNDDIFCMESLLSSEDIAKQKLKRKNIQDTDSEVDHKKSKYGNYFNHPKQVQKTDKHNAAGIFSRKSSLTRKQLKTTPINVEKKKSQISFEKRKINTSGKKSKLIVKKNGKKFLFPDRSKFSLKKLNISNNVADETQDTSTTKIGDVAPQNKIIDHVGETNKDLINYSCSTKNSPLKIPIEKQGNIKSSTNVDPEKVTEKDIVIFSSPINMKRIDSDTPIHNSAETPTKSTGLTFGHFSLKSIKPPSNLKTKEILSQHSGLPPSGNKDESKLEDNVSKTIVESEKCLNTSEKESAAILQKNESLLSLSATCKKVKESHEHNEQVSNSDDKGKLLRTLVNVSDSCVSKNDSSLEKTTTQNNRKENTNAQNGNVLDLREESFENLSKESFFLKASITNKKLNDTVCSMDKSLSNDKNSVSKIFSIKEKILETQTNDLDRSNGTNETVKIMPKNVVENCNSNKMNGTDCSTEKSLDSKEMNSLKVNVHNKDELLQESENVLNLSVSTNVNLMSMEKEVNKNLNEYQNAKQTNGADHVTVESLENVIKDKFLMKSSLPSTPLNEKTVYEKKTPKAHKFEPCGFDIRLSKSIVAKLMKSAKTQKISNAPKILDEAKKLTKPDILLPENIVLDSISVRASSQNSQLFSSDSAENSGSKIKGKRGKKKKIVQPIASSQSSIKSFPLLPDPTENVISNLQCPPSGITCFEKEKQNFQDKPSGVAKERILSPTPSLTKDFTKRCPPNEVTSEVKEARVQKLPCSSFKEPNVLPLPVSTESQSTDTDKNREGSSPLRKNTRQTILKSKENSQPKPNEASVNVKEKKKNCPRKECMSMATPVALADNCISNQTSVQQKSTKSFCDIEVLEPKKELSDETVVLQFRPTNLLTNDSFLNKIKLNESPDTSINKGSTDINVCTSSLNTFGNEQINPKFTIFELPAFIVMKTKIITRKELETNKTLIPPVIKQQIDTESENVTTESVVKTERPEFNSVCAKINSLLEQNANYLKFASGSERLTRMNDVLADYSLSVEDANCTFKFLQSYLSSGPRDKAIKTRGQQFIPIYDSQKKIIGYRKRTIHVKPLSSRVSSRRMTKINVQPSVRTTVNVIQNTNIVENGTEFPTKIEPELLDVGESELIVPDTSPANDICIKNEEDHME